MLSSLLQVRAGPFPRRSMPSCVIIAAALASPCIAQKASAVASSAPSFATEVMPILEKNCTGCHSSAAHKGGLVLENYVSLMKGGRHGQVIVPRDAETSRLIAMIEGKLDPRMPLESDPLGSADIKVIRSWIGAGAAGPPENAALASGLKSCDPVRCAASPRCFACGFGEVLAGRTHPGGGRLPGGSADRFKFGQSHGPPYRACGCRAFHRVQSRRQEIGRSGWYSRNAPAKSKSGIWTRSVW